MNASISSINGAMAYQLGDRRVLVKRTPADQGAFLMHTYQVKRNGVWCNTTYQRGVQPLIEKVKAALAA